MADFFGYLGLTLICLGLLGFVAGFIGMATDFDAITFGVPFGIASLLLGLVLTLPAIVVAGNEQRGKFMEDCLKDRKEYECTAMPALRWASALLLFHLCCGSVFFVAFVLSR